jgi:hypothetical protein
LKDGTVKFGASFQGSTGLAVLDSPSAVVAELGLGSDSPLPLQEALAGDPARMATMAMTRYVLFRAGYRAEGAIEGSHPIGAFGTVGFGAAGEADHLYAIVHRIAPETGARSALATTIGGIRLPRQIREVADLPAGSMVIAEANASLALNLTAQLGYDFSFVRNLGELGLDGDISLKLEAGLEAALGITASGRFLVAIDRASSDDSLSAVRIRLFKLRQKGWDFGLNLAVGVTAATELPEKADDFVKAVFGVHGQQVVRELHRIEEWTDPKNDLSELVAGLGTEQGLELLKKTTGVDPRTRFNDAREKLVSALDFWNDLPETATNAAWNLLDDLAGSSPARKRAVDALRLLAGTNESELRDALMSLVAATDFETSPIGRFIANIADGGVLSLLDDADLPDTVQPVLAVLEGDGQGGVIRRLHDYVENALDIEKLRTISAADFDQVNAWLVGRLSSFIDGPLDSDTVESIRALINKVVTLRQDVYDRARQAMNRQYDFSLAASWQKTTTRKLLLDAEFDMASESGRAMFAAVVGKADYDRLLSVPDPAVRLRSATMSHEIQRRSSVAVNMPFFDSKKTRLNKALASLKAEDDGERVLVYSLDASDEVTEVNRMRSSLGVTALLAVPVAGVRVHQDPAASWSYSYRMARKDMRSGEVTETLRPLVEKYFPDQFPDDPNGSLDKWVADLDRAVEDATGNGTTEFGDVLLSLDLRLAGNAMAPWLVQRTRGEAEAAAKRVSISLQRQLKELIPSYYFQDPDKLWDNAPASALIVWAALPPMNDMRVIDGKVVERPDSRNVYWNWPDVESRRAMVLEPRTIEALREVLRHYEDRLSRSGRAGQARRFRNQQVQTFVDESGIGAGAQLQSLLFSEATLVEEARKALIDISGFWSDAPTAPSRALERMAEFGAGMTKTFNSRLASLYGRTFLRPLGSAIFLEVARALDPGLDTLRPDALMVIKVLKEDANYDLNAFLENTMPDASSVVLEQRLVSAGT